MMDVKPTTAEKRMYHVAHLHRNGKKVCGLDKSLKDAIEQAEHETVGWASRAKSGYQWRMSDGDNIGVERAEKRDALEIMAVSIFEQDNPALDPKPTPTPLESIEALLTRIEALEAKAALLDRINECITSHKSEHFGTSIYISTGEMEYGMALDDPEWTKFPLMNVLRDVWKLYHADEFKGE